MVATTKRRKSAIKTKQSRLKIGNEWVGAPQFKIFTNTFRTSRMWSSRENLLEGVEAQITKWLNENNNEKQTVEIVSSQISVYMCEVVVGVFYRIHYFTE